jgi:hypothetical protein
MRATIVIENEGDMACIKNTFEYDDGPIMRSSGCTRLTKALMDKEIEHLTEIAMQVIDESINKTCGL